MQCLIFILSIILISSQTNLQVLAQNSEGDVTSDQNFFTQKIKELDLISAQRIALQHNPSIQAITARIELASSIIHQEKSAYYPRISSEISGKKVQDRPNDQSFGAEGVTGEQYLAKITLKWLLFDNNVRKFKVKSAEYNERSSVEAARDAQRLLLNALTQTFYDVLLARYQKETALANIDFNQKFFDEIKIKQRFGSASSADVLNFELRRESAKIDLLDAERNLKFGKIVLVQLMGVSDYVDVDEITLKETLIKELPDDEIPFEDEVARALELRPDIIRLEAVIEKSKLEIESQFRSLFPKVEFVGDLRAFRRDGLFFEREDLGGTYGILASWDLFSGGAKWEAYQSKKEELRVAEFELTNQKNIIESEIKQHIEHIKSVNKKLKVQQEINRLTKEIRDTIEKEYKAGRASITRLNEVQRDLVISEQNLALTWIEYYLTRNELDSSTGKNLETISSLE